MIRSEREFNEDMQALAFPAKNRLQPLYPMGELTGDSHQTPKILIVSV
jgi:hypothetical protein